VTLTEREQWLLEAACASGDRAADGWERWRRNADFDRLEPGAYQMLPAVFRNLEPQDPSDSAFRKAKAIYRRTWVANQVVLREAGERCRGFSAKGVACAVAGDAALALLAYPDPGARPIEGLEVLTAEGSTSRFTHSLIKAAVPRRVGEVEVRVLAPAGLLLLACERIVAWDRRPLAPALADAWKLLDRLEARDWARLLKLARRARSALTLRRGLERLKLLGAGPLPAEALRELAAVRTGWIERLEYRIKSRAPWTMPGRTVALLALSHLRAGAAGDQRAGLPALPRVVLHHLAGRRRGLPSAAVALGLAVLPACAKDLGDGVDRVALRTSRSDSPYEIELKLFRLPEGSRHLNHFTYSLKMGKDGFLYLGIGDNRDNGNLLRFDPATERIVDLGDFRANLPAEARSQGNYGKFHVGPHQTKDGSVYFASYTREWWDGEQAGRLFRYRESEGIVDLGPTPNNQGVYYMHGDDVHDKLYFANHDSHFAVYDIATAAWHDKGQFTTKPPFIGLTDEQNRLYMYGYAGKGFFAAGPATIARYDPRSDTLETSKNAPPTLWVGAVTRDHLTAFTTSYLDADIYSWPFADWPNFRAKHHGRIDPRGRPVDSNSLSLTPDQSRLVLAGSINSKHNWHLGQVHGVWIYEIDSGRRYFSAKLNDALSESFGRNARKLKIYWTNADTRDDNGWIYVGIHIISDTDSQARLLALRVHPKQ
jgi:hypothetical protein